MKSCIKSGILFLKLFFVVFWSVFNCFLNIVCIFVMSKYFVLVLFDLFNGFLTRKLELSGVGNWVVFERMFYMLLLLLCIEIMFLERFVLNLYSLRKFNMVRSRMRAFRELVSFSFDFFVLFLDVFIFMMVLFFVLFFWLLWSWIVVRVIKVSV